MFKIVKKRQLSDKVILMDIEAKRVAKKCLPGEFVIVKANEKGERIPLTVCDYNRDAGTVTIVFQTVGFSTELFGRYNEGDYYADFVGPLGNPSELVVEDPETLKDKKILFVGGGLGIAPVYPQVKWLHEHGIACDSVIGARNADLLILREEMEAVSDNLYIATDDGSIGQKGLVTDVIKQLVTEQGKKYDLCVTIGPMIMMKFVCNLTKELGIPTVASINPMMVDGPGMCGACRLTVGEEIKFACVDGPEFDAHLIDFDEAMKRQQIYKTAEGREMLKILEGDTHHGGCGYCGGDK